VTDIAAPAAALLDLTVRLAASGDQAAFAALVAEYHPTMTRVAYAIGGDAEVAADAVQSAWTIAWRRLPTLRDRSHVRSWLVAIAANEARQALRRQRVRTVVELDLDRRARPSDDPGERIESVDLARALRRLGPDDRTLLALRFVAGLESRDIATHLGLSASGVRSRLARLLDRLRQELDHA
jgi:RNA polymerase sigma-70 factor (ECF subfamily)